MTWFGIDAWRICLAAALLLAFVFYKLFASRREEGAAPVGAALLRGMGIKYTQAPTVRLTDTQRIDRLQRSLTLKVGEAADLKDLTFGRFPRLALRMMGIELDGGQDFARIKVDLGGAEARCGADVKDLNDNDFLVPRAGLDDQRSSILYYCNKPDAVSFLQIKVKRVDAVEQSAHIEVLHVRGRWGG